MGNNVSIGLLGLGVVGSGVIKLIESHQEKLSHQLGCNVDVKGVLVRDLDKYREVGVDQRILTTNPDDVIQNPEIDIIVEVMGGIELAREYILKAFAAKKHVVTANKDLVALYGPELQEAASNNKCDFYYEASVAGGIPILRSINDGLSSDLIRKVMGIVNGTTNYILTKMDKEGLSYETALKQAQELGFAEADPTSDVEGLDAARKMAILCRLAFSMDVDLNDVEVKGISSIDLEDLNYAKQLDLTMKLIGYANFEDQKLDVSVQPTLLSHNHPLSSVNNEYNAVYVYGEAVGETMFYGPGAGSLPTATAIMSDVVTVIKNMLLNVTGTQFVEPHFKKDLKAPSERFAQYYVRMHVKDEVGVLSIISKLFNERKISFKQILQNPVKEKGTAEIVVVTHQTSLENFRTAMKQLHELDEVIEIKSNYKVEGDAEE
ncbi:homoserine dehydrogenase [Oceanobacillus piezotolerans]|uniref:Homoserine dehydrogenase n=1 Tax=Oceanobacillus piezotolerans TaxID=2448030 RepID=A0A498DAK8_9BACI|nr:homoserine dehydrogenase [Oceanobacillus piezotolerans]RLL42008.1 homoserine dehydrogenase [Oceanobacillus piezotolerans]